MRKLLVTDGIGPDGRRLLDNEAKSFLISYYDKISNDDLHKEIQDAEVLLVRTATPITASVLGAAKQLRLIVRAGVGVDHIDLKTANDRGIAVTHTAEESADAVAELTIGLLLSSARNLSKAYQSVADGNWSRGPLMGFELRGKSLGILGFGRIGRRVALRLKSFEMNILACDPYISRSEVEHFGIPLLPLDELLKQSDILTIHTPLTHETRKLFSASTLNLLKPGALLINTARGEIVDEKDILSALQSNVLSAYIADTFEKEPLDPRNSLVGHPRTVLTPHIGAQTVEAQSKVSIAAAMQIVQYFKSGEIKNRIHS